MYDLGVFDGLVYIDGEFIKTNVYINNETIVKISKNVYETLDKILVSNSLVIPSLIDPHVHFYLDLGSTHSKDDFFSGSIQAAFGGITTIIDFLDPVDNPVDLELAYNKTY